MKFINLKRCRRITTSVVITCILALSLASIANGQKFRYYGTTRSDWATFTFPSAGGQIRWRVLRNDNPSTGSSPLFDIPFGLTDSELVPNQGNWGGSATHDLAVYRDNTGTPANTYIVNQLPSGPTTYTNWGLAVTDFIGSEGDYDGDGIMDYTVVRAPTDTSPFVWWVLLSSDSTMRVFRFGTNATDIAL
ncbi:MAG TPA: hypothetical protein VJV05_11485, partial [Pyrinomonadaceae bacterium]|nr:hypothetical protein [Pyrinomonadaceae bacterium]